jgi:radical SAM protein with 4Fe4S-binding SPASM domain
LIVFYEVTQSGEPVCKNCRSYVRSPPAELTTQQSLQLINQLVEFPVPPTLMLTGGDPFKRADIFEIVECASRRHLNVSITPSATSLVTQRGLRRLRCAGISRVAVRIDGANARTHDTVRGIAGSYYQSLKMLADARAEGIPTQVNTTVTPANLGQIDDMAEIFARAQIDLWSVIFLELVGRARNVPRLSASEYEVAFERLYRQSECRPYRINTTEAPQYRRFLIQQRVRDWDTSGCRSPSSYVPLGVNDRNTMMFVSHAGLIHPSRYMPIVCGVYPLQHIVRIYQDSPVLRKLRDEKQLQGKCKQCEIRHICGGSRARAYAVTGSPLAEDPDCEYVPEACTAA